MINHQATAAIEQEWATARWTGVERPYAAEEVYKIRGSVRVEQSLARRGAEKLWELVNGSTHIAALGALTGNQAVQMAQAGLKAIYLSGWQVAADATARRRSTGRQSLAMRRSHSSSGAWARWDTSSNSSPWPASTRSTFPCSNRARAYNVDGMYAYSNLQQREFALADQGYGAVRHQRFVGTGYFDLVSMTISGGETSTNAMTGSTEEEQIETEAVGAH